MCSTRVHPGSGSASTRNSCTGRRPSQARSHGGREGRHEGEGVRHHCGRDNWTYSWTASGSGAVTLDLFEGFDYVALGHLHRPQNVGSSRIHYPGSLLKYSFNEVDHTKGVTLVEIGADGVPAIRSMPLIARRDVRIVKGTLADLLNRPEPTLSRDDYLCAHLTDAGPVLEPMARLREVYPNMMELRFDRSGNGDPTARARGDHRQRAPADLFRAFYRDVVGEDIGDAAIDVFNESVRHASSDAEQGTA